MSSYSVKMRTRVSFHAPAAAGLRRPGAAGPGTCARGSSRPAADPGVGQAAGRLGDSRHLVEQRAPRRPAASAPAARRWRPRPGRLPPARSSSSGSVGAVVVAADAARRAGRAGRPAPARPGRLGLLPLPLDGAAVDVEGAGERLDGGQQPLLQPGDRAAPPPPACAWSRPAAAPRAAARYSSSSAESRSSGASAGRPSMSICATTRSGKPPCDLADVLLEPADHDVVEQLLALDRHAAAEPLRVEDLQQGGEAVGVAVVRRGRQEQPVLEARGQVADGPGDLRVDGVPRAAGRGGVVGLVEDEQRAGPEVAEPVAQRAGVGLVDQQPVRDEEPRVRRPGVDAVAALPADAGDVVLVEDLERQAEARAPARPATAAAPTAGRRRRCRGPSCGAAARGRSGRPRWSCRGRRRRR